jgi:shikimate dehydrogenase
MICFLGISTGGSVARRAFEGWMRLLGADFALERVDLPAGAPAQSYRQLMDRIRSEAFAGLTVTAHKTALFEHAGDLLDGVDEPARIASEISVIYSNAHEFRGTIIEPKSIAATLTELGGDSAMTLDTADVVVLGAGGTAVSLVMCLTEQAWPASARPRRIHFVDTSPQRLAHVAALSNAWPPSLETRTILSEGEVSLADLGPLPAKSLIVNATGLGKDRPGSPISLPTSWPLGAKVWDLNYRGDLLMPQAARDAEASSAVHAYDGWNLFINGWAEGLSKIMGRSIDQTERAAMNEHARTLR